jgi:TRAP-type C4-dicarboxylate transport system permease small subunit
VALETKEKETLKAKREKQPEPHQPEGYVYGLDPISFSLVTLFFMAVLAVLVAALGSDTVQLTIRDNVYYVSTFLLTLLVLFVITIPILAWRVRRSHLDAIADTDKGPIPWDFIAVLVMGLLVVGVGIGLMLFINRPV